MNWTEISKEQELSETFIEEMQGNLDWEEIAKTQNLPVPFLIKYQHKLTWNHISKFQILEEEFIALYEKKVNWGYVSQYQNLSETFIENFKKRLDWKQISQYQTLSKSFIEKYKDEVDWDFIFFYQKVSLSFVLKHICYLKINLILSPKNINFTNKEKEIITNAYEEYWEQYITLFNHKTNEIEVKFKKKKFPYMSKYERYIKVIYNLNENNEITFTLKDVYENELYKNRIQISFTGEAALYHLLEKYIREPKVEKPKKAWKRFFFK